MAAVDWQNGYAEFLRNPANQKVQYGDRDNQNFFCLKDMDSDDIPELFITGWEDDDGGFAKFYSYNGKVYELGKIKTDSTTEFYITENPSFPGLFRTCWGGYREGRRVHGYEYIYIKNLKLVTEVLGDEWSLLVGEEPLPGYTITSNKELLAEAKKVFNSYEIQLEGYNEITEPNIQGIVFGWQNPAAAPNTSSQMEVRFKGENLNFNHPTITKSGRKFYPMRELLEAIGATINWNSQTKTAKGTLGSKTVEFTIGSNKYKVNGQSKSMESYVVPFIDNGLTYIPIRYTAEGLGYKVSWDAVTGITDIE